MDSSEPASGPGPGAAGMHSPPRPGAGSAGLSPRLHEHGRRAGSVPPPATAKQPRLGHLSGLWRVVAPSVLPHDYPSSVSRDYAEYHVWQAASLVLAAATGVLSTTALLTAVGVDSASAGASAASLQWILKDLVGSLARVLFAGVIRDRLDREVIAWRFRSDVLHCAGGALELATCLAPGAFLVLACGGNALKAAAALAGLATRANLAQTFAAAADVQPTGKGAADPGSRAGDRSTGTADGGDGGGGGGGGGHHEGRVGTMAADPHAYAHAAAGEDGAAANRDSGTGARPGATPGSSGPAAPVAGRSNLADLLAKTDSQGVVAGVVGTALGLLLTQCCAPLSPAAMFALFSAGTAGQLYLTWKMLRVLRVRHKQS